VWTVIEGQLWARLEPDRRLASLRGDELLLAIEEAGPFTPPSSSAAAAAAAGGGAVRWCHLVSSFLAWIGSPCLRHCVHGASIGAPPSARGVWRARAAAGAFAAAQQGPSRRRREQRESARARGAVGASAGPVQVSSLRRVPVLCRHFVVQTACVCTSSRDWWRCSWLSHALPRGSPTAALKACACTLRLMAHGHVSGQGQQLLPDR
jgi:hypothetical protein